MAKASDNIAPQLLVVEGTTPSISSSGSYPGIATGKQALFIDSATHHLNRVDHTGTPIDLETNQGGGGGGGGDLTLITATLLGSNAASVAFNSIASTYRHLVIKAVARGDTALGSVPFLMQFNSDTGSNYDAQYIETFSSGTTANTGTRTSASSSIPCGLVTGASSPANEAGIVDITINGYKGTVFHKVVNFQTGEAFGTGTMDQITGSGQWRSTAAITDIVLKPSAGNFITGSLFCLYGWN